MSRQVTKAAGNRYCQARLEAAKSNEKLCSRAGAAEYIGCISEDSIKKYELGITNPPNDVVAVMADAYNAPELAVWYCASECPLGKNCREVPQMPPERTFIRVSNSLGTLNQTLRELSQIMDDGVCDERERKQLPQLMEDFLEARRRMDEALAVLEKLQKEMSI